MFKVIKAYIIQPNIEIVANFRGISLVMHLCMLDGIQMLKGIWQQCIALTLALIWQQYAGDG